MLRLQVSGPMQVGWFILEKSDSESGDLVARHRRLPLTIELGLRGNWHLVKNYSTLEACVCRWAQGSESRTRARKVFCVFHVLPQVLGGPLSKFLCFGCVWKKLLLSCPGSVQGACREDLLESNLLKGQQEAATLQSVVVIYSTIQEGFIYACAAVVVFVVEANGRQPGADAAAAGTGPRLRAGAP